MRILLRPRNWHCAQPRVKHSGYVSSLEAPKSGLPPVCYTLREGDNDILCSISRIFPNQAKNILPEFPFENILKNPSACVLSHLDFCLFPIRKIATRASLTGEFIYSKRTVRTVWCSLWATLITPGI